jgi:hypothetical protein
MDLLTTALLAATVSYSPVPAAAAVPPERVRALVQQLDDDRFNVRQEADRGLRQLGVAALQLLRKEMEGAIPLESRRRLGAIVDDITHVHWQRDFHTALRQAQQSGKPLLVFSTAGLPSAPISLESAAMQTRTFTDLGLISYLNENFVTVWHDPTPGEFHAMGRVLKPAQFTPEQVRDCKEAFGAETHTYLCTPQGIIVQHLQGFHTAQRLLKDAKGVCNLPAAQRPKPVAPAAPDAGQVVLAQNVEDSALLLQNDVQLVASGQPAPKPAANPVGKHVWDATVELERSLRARLYRGC